jgi:hypothetical protein
VAGDINIKGRWHEVLDEVWHNEFPPHQSAAQTASPQGEALRTLMKIITFWGNKENNMKEYPKLCNLTNSQ